MNIVGLQVRTSNEDGRGAKDLGQLWEDFLQRTDILGLPERVDSLIYCIYTDYESNYTGEYTAVIGVEVKGEVQVPTQAVSRVFEGGKYEIFVAKGAMPQAVVETWQHIWANEAQLHRTYLYDYEVYGLKENEVSIFIGIR